MTSLSDVFTSLEPAWRYIETIVQKNSRRVVEAFRQSGLATSDLQGTTGYGYGDRGRDILDRIVAEIFGCPAGLLRAQWVSGTHALTTTLRAFGPQTQRIWLANGRVYDTLAGVIAQLSQEWGWEVIALPTNSDGRPAWDRIREQPSPGDIVYIQRSRGYEPRPAWGPQEIKPVIEWAHRGGAYAVVDNCYGEFTQPEEPGHWGADLVVGSLMKNAGGAIAPTGAYVAGQDALVEKVADQLIAPGIGREVGATHPYQRLLAQGLFLAPLLVGEALMGGLYLSAKAEALGIPVDPPVSQWDRNDIVVSLELGRPERVVRFCQTIQAWSPVDAHVTPEPWAMPGYPNAVIMAAGGFVAGASLELSADAPMREPYRVYVQGGINRWHTLLAVDQAFQAALD